MDLTEEELALALRLGFDLKVLGLIKTTLKVPLREFEGASSLEFYKDTRHEWYWPAETKQHQIAILERIAARSPDAISLISSWIATLAGPLTGAECEYVEAQDRNREFMRRAAPFADYIAEEWKRIRIEAASGFFGVPSFLQDVGDGDGMSVDDRIEQMKLYFADKPRPEPQQSIAGSKRNTVPPETGVVIRISTLYWTPQRDSLRSALKKTPYKLTELSNYMEDQTFWSKPEADDYSASLRGVGNGGSRIVDPKPYQIGEEDNSRRKFEGDETITRVGPITYEVLKQKRFLVNYSVTIVLLSKK